MSLQSHGHTSRASPSLSQVEAAVPESSGTAETKPWTEQKLAFESLILILTCLACLQVLTSQSEAWP